MIRLIIILAAAFIGIIFFVAPAAVAAAAPLHEKSCAIEITCRLETDKVTRNYLDFWSKFRDTVMPEKPQNNNPPKEHRPKPSGRYEHPSPPPRNSKHKH